MFTTLCTSLFQEEDALLSEMEFTGQAFEEMQEQNIRVLQELREKEEANLKLMSEVSIVILVIPYSSFKKGNQGHLFHSSVSKEIRFRNS